MYIWKILLFILCFQVQQMRSGWLYLHFPTLFASVIQRHLFSVSLLINQSAVRVYGNCCLKNKEQLIIRLPFGIYFGWITVAFVANITTLLVSYGFDGGSYERYITVGILLLAAGIASLFA